MGKRAGPRGREIRIALHDGGWDGDERVTGVLVRPGNAVALLVLAHGAGAGMRHAFMERISAELLARKIAVFRYQFPHMEAGRRSPSPRAVLIATVRAALREAQGLARGLPLVAGGKSMGGRMTSLAATASPLERVSGLVFLGFPLHAAGRPSRERADHLARIDLPMLFLQGTRDKLAEFAEIEPVCAGLGARASMHVVEGADHSFHVLKRSGRSDPEVMTELADTIDEFTRALHA
jgi:hypothetical protein